MIYLQNGDGSASGRQERERRGEAEPELLEVKGQLAGPRVFWARKVGIEDEERGEEEGKSRGKQDTRFGAVMQEEAVS